MKKPYTAVLSILGMLLILSLGVELEHWIYNLRQISQREMSGPTSWIVPTNLAILVHAGLLMVWLWFVYNKDQSNRWVAIIYALAGLGLLFYTVVAIEFSPRLPLPMQVTRFPISHSAFVSAVVAIVGLHKLFRREAAP